MNVYMFRNKFIHFQILFLSVQVARHAQGMLVRSDMFSECTLECSLGALQSDLKIEPRLLSEVLSGVLSRVTLVSDTNCIDTVEVTKSDSCDVGLSENLKKRYVADHV